MDYIYIGQFSIIDTIKFKNYILSNDDNNNNEIINELVKHLNNYKNIYNIPNNLLLHNLNAIEIEKEVIICEQTKITENKKTLLIYIIFLTDSKFTIQSNEIDMQKGNIIIFPSEWFFYFKLSKNKIITGNVYEFKE